MNTLRICLPHPLDVKNKRWTFLGTRCRLAVNHDFIIIIRDIILTKHQLPQSVKTVKVVLVILMILSNAA